MSSQLPLVPALPPWAILLLYLSPLPPPHPPQIRHTHPTNTTHATITPHTRHTRTQELAERLAAAESRDAARVAEERKRRNYVDFWAPIPPTEPFRVVLAHMRDRLYNTRQVRARVCFRCPTANHCEPQWGEVGVSQ